MVLPFVGAGYLSSLCLLLVAAFPVLLGLLSREMYNYIAVAVRR